MAQTWGRVLAWGAWLLVILLMLASLGAVWLVRRSFPQTTGTLAVAGLSSTVEVRRDALGVPHVYADTSDDLFFAQGFVHAQDRFWEMDFRRHVTAGRLAEMFGQGEVPSDVFLRTLGWRRVAEAELELLSEETVAALESYAAGVNGFLKGRSPSAISLEYAVLALQNREYEIEPWGPVDSLVWLKAMAWDLRSNIDSEIARVQIAAAVGVERTEQLYPEYPWERHQPVVTAGAVADEGFDQNADPGTEADVGIGPLAGVTEADAGIGPLAGVTEAIAAVQVAVDAVPVVLGAAGPGLGSNSWVLAGSRTESGAPILANDAHLRPSMPSIWYQMGLHCRSVSVACPYDVAGVTFSGLPGVVVGHNADIAWGFTNLSADVADLYLEQVRGDVVVVDGVEVPLQARTERIEVAGGEAVTITVRSTTHGPLLSDVDDLFRDVGRDAPANEGRDGLAVALRWTALDPGHTADAILGLNTAADFDEFRDAARLFEVPAQNLLYADTDGNIGYQAPGRFPVRGRGDGRWPAPGWDSAYDWIGEVPFEALPSVLNPDEGYISSANQPIIDLRDYPYWLGEDWTYGSRGQRIADLVEAADEPWNVRAVGEMQLDSYSEIAEFLVPPMLAIQGLEGPAADAQALLGGWDLEQPEDCPAAAYFNVVWRALLDSLVGDELGANSDVFGGSRWFEVVRTLWDTPSDPWWDDTSTIAETENRDQALRAAMQEGARELVSRLGEDPQAWEWGDLHSLELVNPTLGTSGIGAVEALFNRGPVRTSGGTAAVNATEWDATLDYQPTWVPSFRLLTDLSDLDASRWVNLTGASGHAFHPHYWDQTALWRQGETAPFPFTPAAVGANSDDLLILEPSPPKPG